MKTVYKYAVPIADCFELNLPKGSRVLCIQTQKGEPFIWALVDPIEMEKEIIHFRLAGTGHPIDEVIKDYVGTFQMYNGNLVFHVFTILKP